MAPLNSAPAIVDAAASATVSVANGIDVSVLSVIGMTCVALRLASFLVRTVPNGVALVLAAGTVGEVASSVVDRIPVEMPRLQPWRQRSMEGIGHKTMHLEHLRDTSLVQGDMEAPMGIGRHREWPALGARPWEAADSAEIGDFVEAFVAKDRQPDFVELHASILAMCTPMDGCPWAPE